ncbi:CBS domain-containing protein [Xenococcus sp. PCC 7305]|uniref:CBS domain-containing protein n=1 Tax=Xenococcus sp. PCC 7305 TaxID=102125 RepID=UPI0002ABF4CA|nr:CBS domain-containing protein [Xenococcus sp. PCC 7305]ELS03005.1 CBS domain-containing protein [Xenococcus sp. PCC 7305]
MQARDVMTTDVLTIDESTKVDDAIIIMEENGLSSLIIEPLDKKDSYGIITEIDVLSKVVARGHNPARLSVREIMTKPCIEVKPDLDIQSVAQLFAKTGICAAPIVQKRLFSPKKLLGVISIRDLIFSGNFVGQTNQSKGLKQDRTAGYRQRVIPDLQQGKSARISQDSLTDYQRLRSQGEISAYSTQIINKMPPQEPTNSPSEFEGQSEQKEDNPQQVTPDSPEQETSDSPQKKSTRLGNEKLTDYQRLRAEGAISRYSTRIFDKMPPECDDG